MTLPNFHQFNGPERKNKKWQIEGTLHGNEKGKANADADGIGDGISTKTWQNIPHPPADH